MQYGVTEPHLVLIGGVEGNLHHLSIPLSVAFDSSQRHLHTLEQGRL